MNYRAFLRIVIPSSILKVLREFRGRVRMRRIGVKPSKTRHKHNVAYLGSAYGGYAVPTELVKGRTGLSFGAGEDISFEISVARKFSGTVHIYDPTPRAVEYCRRTISKCHASVCGRLFIHPYGVWSECKKERFYVPSNPDHVSHSIVNMQKTGSYFEAECLSPAEILDRLQLETVSFVKLNIEGAEYEVVNAMFDSQIKPDVICINFDELHSPIDRHATSRLRGLVGRLFSESYLPVHAVECKVTFVQGDYEPPIPEPVTSVIPE